MFYIKILNPTLDLKLDIYFVQNNIWLIVLILDQKNLFTQILLRTLQFSLGPKSNSTQNLSVALPAQLVSYYFEIIYRLSNIFYKIRETQLLSHNLRVTNFFYHFVCIMLARVRQGSGSWDHNFLYHAFIMFKDIGTILFSCEKLIFFPDSGCPPPLPFAEILPKQLTFPNTSIKKQAQILCRCCEAIWFLTELFQVKRTENIHEI